MLLTESECDERLSDCGISVGLLFLFLLLAHYSDCAADAGATHH
jgi:hypothetical protein